MDRILVAVSATTGVPWSVTLWPVGTQNEAFWMREKERERKDNFCCNKSFSRKRPQSNQIGEGRLAKLELSLKVSSKCTNSFHSYYFVMKLGTIKVSRKKFQYCDQFMTGSFLAFPEYFFSKSGKTAENHHILCSSQNLLVFLVDEFDLKRRPWIFERDTLLPLPQVIALLGITL